MLIAAEECAALNRREVFETYLSRETALGNLPIWRALPVRHRRLIGPWCFLDRYGPISFTDQKPMDVAPHPHIGLQTVSWLLEGEVVHHDSLGYEAVARPGSVNVMTAGLGIAHAEETPVANEGRLNGVQLWVALPDAHRNVAPSFQHVAEVPRMELRGGIAQVFLGDDCAAETFSDTVGIDLTLHNEIEFPVRPEREHGIFLLSGNASFENQPLSLNTLHYLGCGRSSIALKGEARMLIVGGEPFAEPVLMWWNFVARQPEEIAAARADWEEGRRFGPVSAYRGPRLAAPPLSRLARPNPAS
ncbi:MAG TPA: pirin family protein [Thermoanaerobaculia bacterium]|jgi:hypothetical protein